ncbi:hypothetical protein Tco_0685261, partial [Tanacetum coccineum]
HSARRHVEAEAELVANHKKDLRLKVPRQILLEEIIGRKHVGRMVGGCSSLAMQVIEFKGQLSWNLKATLWFRMWLYNASSLFIGSVADGAYGQVPTGSLEYSSGLVCFGYAHYQDVGSGLWKRNIMYITNKGCRLCWIGFRSSVWIWNLGYAKTSGSGLIDSMGALVSNSCSVAICLALDIALVSMYQWARDFLSYKDVLKYQKNAGFVYKVNGDPVTRYKFKDSN